MSEISGAPLRPEPNFIGRVLVIVLVLALLTAVWHLAQVFLIGFGGIVVAVALNNVATPMAKHTGLSDHLALAITTVGFTLLLFGFLALFGAGTSEQFGALFESLPAAWVSAKEWLQQWELGRQALAILESSTGQAATALLGALPVASALVSGFGNAFLILVIGIYLAADAASYCSGVLRLLPPDRRQRGREIMNAAGHNLRRWLNAMALDMIFLGVITSFGLWLVDVPFALALGVLSGLSVFVPYIGPIVATVPGLLLALSVSPELAAYAALVYVVAQQLEGNISLPLLQRWTVHMPPVVSLLAIVAFGLLFGLWGVLLATPLTVVVMTIIRMAYIEDVLEKRQFG